MAMCSTRYGVEGGVCIYLPQVTLRLLGVIHINPLRGIIGKIKNKFFVLRSIFAIFCQKQKIASSQQYKKNKFFVLRSIFAIFAELFHRKT